MTYAKFKELYPLADASDYARAAGSPAYAEDLLWGGSEARQEVTA